MSVFRHLTYWPGSPRRTTVLLALTQPRRWPRPGRQHLRSPLSRERQEPAIVAEYGPFEPHGVDARNCGSDASSESNVSWICICFNRKASLSYSVPSLQNWRTA